MTKQLKEIEIPFGANDSELCGWEYTIPEGMEATIVDNKIIVKKKESEDERIKNEITELVMQPTWKTEEEFHRRKELCAWIEKQGEKIYAIENFDTEFEKQVSRLIASAISKEHEYNEGFVKWTANGLLNYAKHELEKQGKQKPSAWSEEDEEMYNKIIKYVKQSYYSEKTVIDWFKSLKDRVQFQNTITDEELAQAKKEAYNNALDKIEYYSGEPSFDDGWDAAIWYLKKRNVQLHKTWEPSDEQIKAFEHFVKSIGESGYASPYDNNTKLLYTLLSDLKETKEESSFKQKSVDKVELFNKYEELTDFERTLADICIGWIGEEPGWKQYIKDSADALLKITMKTKNNK